MSVMSELTIPFFGLTEAEVNSTGVFTSVSFDTVRKLLEPAVDIEEGEKITGLVITSDGIKIMIDKK